MGERVNGGANNIAIRIKEDSLLVVAACGVAIVTAEAPVVANSNTYTQGARIVCFPNATSDVDLVLRTREQGRERVAYCLPCLHNTSLARSLHQRANQPTGRFADTRGLWSSLMIYKAPSGT